MPRCAPVPPLIPQRLRKPAQGAGSRGGRRAARSGSSYGYSWPSRLCLSSGSSRASLPSPAVPPSPSRSPSNAATATGPPLFKSYADSTKHYGVALNDATNTGKGIGIAIIVAISVVVDFFLGVGYGIYKLATR